MNDFVMLKVVCSHCGKVHQEAVRFFPDYHGKVLKSFWCQHCEQPLVVRYGFEGHEATVLEHIEDRESVLAPHRPRFGGMMRVKEEEEMPDGYYN